MGLFLHHLKKKNLVKVLCLSLKYQETNHQLDQSNFAFNMLPLGVFIVCKDEDNYRVNTLLITKIREVFKKFVTFLGAQ